MDIGLAQINTMAKKKNNEPSLPGIPCQNADCVGGTAFVQNTYPQVNWIRRRRVCDKCKHSFHTRESVEKPLPAKSITPCGNLNCTTTSSPIGEKP